MTTHKLTPREVELIEALMITILSRFDTEAFRLVDGFEKAIIWCEVFPDKETICLLGRLGFAEIISNSEDGRMRFRLYRDKLAALKKEVADGKE